MHLPRLTFLVLTLVFFCRFDAAHGLESPDNSKSSVEIPQVFFGLVSGNSEIAEQSLTRIESGWDDSFVPMVLEFVRLARVNEMTRQLVRIMEKKSGQNFGLDLQKWQQWIWNRPEKRHPDYAIFKSRLYAYIDPIFSGYFNAQRATEIRLDEVVWGGVRQDGIPPLRNPKMISAADATYLDDSNVVFGISVNDDVRAYPKRLLAWHEMFVDTVGDVPVAGVYCTLCGTVILYKTEHKGVNHKLGTSGFLYRSNKLMYDEGTQSLWNTMWGTPVIGPLVGMDIKLEYLSVVTTTWGEWRRRHPDTQVLSLDTGHTRDYSEGAAYKDYFGTDQLMFKVPETDDRLLNKDEIFAVILSQYPDQPLAISEKFLNEHPVYNDRIGDIRFVIITDKTGANRMFESGDISFANWDDDHTVMDEDGNQWTLTETSLESKDGRKLDRLPGHRAFWFGWYSAYSHTRLIH